MLTSTRKEQRSSTAQVAGYVLPNGNLHTEQFDNLCNYLQYMGIAGEQYHSEHPAFEAAWVLPGLGFLELVGPFAMLDIDWALVSEHRSTIEHITWAARQCGFVVVPIDCGDYSLYLPLYEHVEPERWVDTMVERVNSRTHPLRHTVETYLVANC